MTGTDASPVPARGGRWRSARLVLRAARVRLRFVVVLGVAFLVVGRWDDLRNHLDRLTRAEGGGGANGSAVSSDTEYFCPMDPGVLSDWPGKCGVCNMSLVRRKKGEAAPLPSGVVARMQISPYRLQLAGVRTSPAEYLPLAREAVLVGAVTSAVGDTKQTARAETEAFERDRAWVAEGQEARAECLALPGREPFRARVKAVVASRVVLEVEDPSNELRPGMAVTARVFRPVDEFEPFRSLPADPPPLRAGETRSVYLCPEHAEVLREAQGRCPVDGKTELEPQALLPNQRVGWWCPMHPTVAADRPGRECRECVGMRLVPRVVTYRPTGKVLSVPESAVVDTGTRTVVYVERMPGMFDGVEVVLGPRCGDAFPVARGLEPGQRVATAGTFLIDAETRLNPSLAVGYFGAARNAGPETTRADRPVPKLEIPPEVRILADAQKVCPVTGKPLGSMGPPLAVTVAGRTVLVCCEGCEGPLTESPARYLARLKTGAGGGPDAPPRPAGRP